MLSVDSETVSGVANTITVSANIHGLGDPSSGDATEDGGETIDVLGGGAAVGVDIAGEAGTVLWVADEEDSLDGVHVGAGELGHGVDGGGGALGVALEDEAHVGVGAEGGLDLVDNLGWMLAMHVKVWKLIWSDIRPECRGRSSGWHRQGRQCCRRYRRRPGRESVGSWCGIQQKDPEVHQYHGWK